MRKYSKLHDPNLMAAAMSDEDLEDLALVVVLNEAVKVQNKRNKL